MKTDELISLLKFGADGLIPAVAQDASDGTVLMVAYMNAESLLATLKTGNATYWSRSRGKLWIKGETSGCFQRVKEILVDCDADCLLVKIEQLGGAACHTGERSCFFRKIENGAITGAAGAKK
ncbi:MAG: phosphoribosyl-AMP cyclohydrolase [Elusimicrobia bacterium HGW-Elusimicrobia-1]|jgi:phosphoribosyl-AMP cyclohydrolase|nr:MAG: phosphoribosyl-AMP cyclohydrolase [Elusimicrobia bacterium HGW-Elusimicrobia-1]